MSKAGLLRATMNRQIFRDEGGFYGSFPLNARLNRSAGRPTGEAGRTPIG
jgi:hypothetical protein